MKKQSHAFAAITISLLLGFVCSPGHANTGNYPAYLNEAYCTDLTDQFIDSGMRSLEKYVNDHFRPDRRRGISNTISFLDKRGEWLGECNAYLLDVKKSNVFYNEQTTDEIFMAMQALARELKHVKDGVEYPDALGQNNPQPHIRSRFQVLAKAVDKHYTVRLMQKQFQ